MFIVALVFTMMAMAQKTCYQQADVELISALLNDKRCESPLDFARKLIGRPYIAHTLEVHDNEQLVINTRQLDCTTLVETVTALTLCRRTGKSRFEDYEQMLTRLRYRGGRLTDYTSRLHYFSDWIDDNHSMGFVTEIQEPASVFSQEQRLVIDYMRQHPQQYKALKAHPEMIGQIASQEKALTGRSYRFIPKADVDKRAAALRKVIKDGDIIAITTSKKGLDIAHLGFAVWRADGLHLLNASQLHKKVVIEPMTLGQYLSKHPSHTGIRIIRINDTVN